MMDGLQDVGSANHPAAFPFTWAEFCDLLDGAPWESVMARQSLLETSGEGEVLRSVRNRLASPNQYFFEINPTKQAIEIFWLKLVLAEALSNVVAECHERCSRSYGVIDPEMVVVELPRQSGSILPVRWTTTVKVRQIPSETPSRWGTMPEEMAQGLTVLLPDADLTFASPLVRQWPLGRELPVTALIQSADVIPDDDPSEVQGLVRVHIIADEIASRDFGGHDVFRLVLPIGTGQDTEVALWARKVDSAERGLVVSGLTDEIPRDLWQAFVESDRQVRSTAKVTVYRSFSAKADVYSCGMLLLRAMLGADAGRWRRVLDAIPAVVENIGPLVQGVDEGDYFTIHVRVKDRLHEWGDLFLHPVIPQDLWWDGLVVALRACSQIEGFGYGLDGKGTGGSPARDLAHDLGCLGRRARTDLFESSERDAMIVRACDQVLAEVG